jgi:hypothetical protein
MRIKTVMDARRAMADCQSRHVARPSQFEIETEDWYAILATVAEGSPVNWTEITICGVPVKVIEP